MEAFAWDSAFKAKDITLPALQVETPPRFHFYKEPWSLRDS